MFKFIFCFLLITTSQVHSQKKIGDSNDRYLSKGKDGFKYWVEQINKLDYDENYWNFLYDMNDENEIYITLLDDNCDTLKNDMDDDAYYEYQTNALKTRGLILEYKGKGYTISEIANKLSITDEEVQQFLKFEGPNTYLPIIRIEKEFFVKKVNNGSETIKGYITPYKLYMYRSTFDKINSLTIYRIGTIGYYKYFPGRASTLRGGFGENSVILYKIDSNQFFERTSSFVINKLKEIIYDY